MEDFLKFLLIVGVILVGIFKEVSKNSKSKKATDKRPVPPTPSPTEIEPDVILMPEAWGKIELPVPQMSSKQASRHAPKQQQQQQQQKKKKKKKRRRGICCRITGQQCRPGRTEQQAGCSFQYSRRIIRQQRRLHHSFGRRSTPGYYMGRDTSTEILTGITRACFKHGKVA